MQTLKDSNDPSMVCVTKLMKNLIFRSLGLHIRAARYMQRYEYSRSSSSFLRPQAEPWGFICLASSRLAHSLRALLNRLAFAIHSIFSRSHACHLLEGAVEMRHIVETTPIATSGYAFGCGYQQVLRNLYAETL